MNLPFSNISEIVIATESHPTETTVLAYSELRRGLRRLTRKISVQDDKSASEGSLLFTLQAAGTAAGSNVESYTIAYHDSSPPRLAINAASEQSLLYAVFDFLERQGVVFGLDGELYPMDSPTHLCLPESDSPWSGIPRFASRGLQPWPDFLNCITIFNEEDLRAYLEAMLRMRLNTLGIHVYGQSQKWAEPFLSFEYGGVGHAAFADTTATDRWGYLPQRTSRYGMSAPQYFDDEIFGADATRYAAGPWETAERSQRLWQSMFNYAAELGIKMGIGFELYQLPEEIVKAVPAQVRATVEHSIADRERRHLHVFLQPRRSHIARSQIHPGNAPRAIARNLSHRLVYSTLGRRIHQLDQPKARYRNADRTDHASPRFPAPARAGQATRCRRLGRGRA